MKKATETIKVTTSSTILCIKVKNTYSVICFAIYETSRGHDSQNEVIAKKDLFYNRCWNTPGKLSRVLKKL